MFDNSIKLDNNTKLYSDPVQIGTIGSWVTNDCSIMQHINKFTNDEKNIMRQMPIDMLNERIDKCKECTYQNVKQCIMRIRKGSFHEKEKDFCDMKQMLLHGFCLDFSSAAIEDIEAAAKGEK